MSAVREAALAYCVENGWFCFPCRPRDKRPLTVNGVHDASDDPAKVAAMFYRPDANLGIDCGRSGLVVIDLDGPVAMERFDALPKTRTAFTSRGAHLYYHGQGRNTVRALGDGIDSRGAGGYTLAPPSVHPSGFVYHWRDPEEPIADLPPDLAAVVGVRPKPRRKPRRPEPTMASALLGAAVERLRAARDGERNNTLNREVYHSRSLVADPVDLAGLWYSEAVGIGLGHVEAVRTIASALGIPPGDVEQQCR